VAKTIALLGALDTKEDDFAFVRSEIERRGHRVLLIDIGVLGGPQLIRPDVTREEVAAAAGLRLADLIARHDRGEAVTAMARGAGVLVRQLFNEDRIAAVMGMGGGAGTTIATMAMRALPIGIPKLMVSTVASGNTEPYVGISDIVMMPAVADVAGLNRISRGVYARAAAAISAMAEEGAATPAEGKTDRPLVAATMFGVTTPCVLRARERLEAAGCEVVVFHATGTGGKTMEQLVIDGLVDAVLDLTTTEWADELVGGILSAGPTRLDAAGAKGVPQVVSVGALDMVNFGAPETIPERFAKRRFYRHNALNTLMRTTPAESAELGRIIAGKLNRVSAPTVLLLPLRGVSALDAEGKDFDDPAARTALYDALRANVDPDKVTVRELDAHINDAAFADLAAETLLSLLEQRQNSPSTGASSTGALGRHGLMPDARRVQNRSAR
jgi:uncharacterized protein (UPF0261 family)